MSFFELIIQLYLITYCSISSEGKAVPLTQPTWSENQEHVHLWFFHFPLKQKPPTLVTGNQCCTLFNTRVTVDSRACRFLFNTSHGKTNCFSSSDIRTMVCARQYLKTLALLVCGCISLWEILDFRGNMSFNWTFFFFYFARWMTDSALVMDDSLTVAYCGCQLSFHRV